MHRSHLSAARPLPFLFFPPALRHFFKCQKRRHGSKRREANFGTPAVLEKLSPTTVALRQWGRVLGVPRHCAPKISALLLQLLRPILRSSNSSRNNQLLLLMDHSLSPPTGPAVDRRLQACYVSLGTSPISPTLGRCHSPLQTPFSPFAPPAPRVTPPSPAVKNHMSGHGGGPGAGNREMMRKQCPPPKKSRRLVTELRV